MQPEKAGRRALAEGAGILVLLVALFHGPSLGHGFVYDDAWTIVDNPFLREPGNLASLLGPGPARAGVPDAGRPTLVATEILDHALWGLSPRGFHLQNLIWHAGTAVLFFLAAAALTGGFLVPFAAAGLFAVHPLHVEAVAAINYREELLAAFFTLAAVCAVGKGGALRAGAFVLALLGVFAKESAMVAPILLVVLEATVGRSGTRRARILDVAVLAAAALVGFLWRAWVMGGAAVVSRAAEIPEEHREPFTALGHGAWGLARGALQIVLPVGLSPEYSGGPRLAIAVPILAAIVGLWARRRRPLLALALLGAIAAYLPTLGFVPLTNFGADRYLYLASMPILLGLAALLAASLGRIPWVARGAPVFDLPRAHLAVAVVVIGFGFGTLRQGRIWRDDRTLWTHATSRAPQSPRAWTALAEARLRSGESMAALQAVRRGLALADDPHGRELLGIVLMQQGDLQGARRELTAALAGAEPHHRAERLNNLGHCELQLGLHDEALARFLEAQRLAPGYDRPWLNAARAYQAKGDPAAARRTLQTLLGRDPGNADALRALEALGP